MFVPHLQRERTCVTTTPKHGTDTNWIPNLSYKPLSTKSTLRSTHLNSKIPTPHGRPMTVRCRATANLYIQAVNLRVAGIADSEGVDSKAGIELITDVLARKPGCGPTSSCEPFVDRAGVKAWPESGGILPSGPDVAFIQLDDLKRDTARWQERNNPGRIQLRPQSSEGSS